MAQVCSQNPNAARIANGIQIFPGSVPIYRGNQLVGGIGVSGDGIDQDDMVSFLGTHNAGLRVGGIGNAPNAIRADRIVVDVGGQDVRLRYISCPFAPFLDTAEQREKFIEKASLAGYESVSVSNKYAMLQYHKHGYSQADAVEVLEELAIALVHAAQAIPPGHLARARQHRAPASAAHDPPPRREPRRPFARCEHGSIRALVHPNTSVTRGKILFNGKDVTNQPAAERGNRAAFTLRLDQERHLKLRLASTVKNRSAQQLVTAALDMFLADIPEIEALANQVGKRD